MSDQELASPAVQKLLLDEIERLEQDCSDSASYRDRFHDADKKVGILEQKAQSNTAFEIISLTCITVGGAAVGYAPSVWSSQPTGFIALVFGVLLIIGGVAAKAVKA